MTNSNPEQDVLDLYDVALLLNYERGATEPRYRFSKLREVAYPGKELQTVLLGTKDWVDDNRPSTQIVFDRPPNSKGEQLDMISPPDLPSNMLPDNPMLQLKLLSRKQLETIYWQARGHDGCYTSVALFQYFFDLFNFSTPIRIRHGPKGKTPGKVYTTCVGWMLIWETSLVNPRHMTHVIMQPEGMLRSTGDDHTMLHAVLGFSETPPSTRVTTVVDLSSLQFGDVGRGPGKKGQGLFALDSMEEFEERLKDYAEERDNRCTKTTQRIRGTPHDDWLLQVAERAKERWDNRDSVKWCGHCGAPPLAGELGRCSGCQNAWYCDEVHQGLAWSYHKQFCKKVVP